MLLEEGSLRRVGSDCGTLSFEFRSVLYRDPSLSGWGDKYGLYHQNGAQGEIENASDVDDNFELPVLQEVGLASEYVVGDEEQRWGSGLLGFKINGTGKMDMISTPSPIRGNRNESYASSYIENASIDTTKDVPSSSRDPIVVSDISKTFLMLMWYFFSTY
ncbi:hypothetical protein Tco_0863654 [Tanacetum coccineum]